MGSRNMVFFRLANSLSQKIRALSVALGRVTPWDMPLDSHAYHSLAGFDLVSVGCPELQFSFGRNSGFD